MINEILYYLKRLGELCLYGIVGFVPICFSIYAISYLFGYGLYAEFYIDKFGNYPIIIKFAFLIFLGVITELFLKKRKKKKNYNKMVDDD